MNQNENNQIDISCRVPLLALFGGAALWLMLGLLFALLASLTFHNPEMFAACPYATYGHLVTAANDLLVYGFAIPAALGVMLWIFARSSEAELALPIVPVAAANFWHLGVFIGVITILFGGSSGYTWLEFPRVSAMLIGVSFVLVAVSCVATLAQRKERALEPAHWFLFAALLWFPWIYSSANLFVVSIHPVRGVAQAVIDWWFANNLIFIWFALVGLGIALYFLPRMANRPLNNRYALFGFWTLILFGTWLGIPQGAPVPAWLPTLSSLASALMFIPLIAITIVFFKNVCCAKTECKGGSFCHIKFGTTAFLLSAFLQIATACPAISKVTEFTWFGAAQTQLQILGFFAVVMCGAIYQILPRMMNTELPFPKFVRVQHWLFMIGLALLIVPLAVAGIQQGLKSQDAAASSMQILDASLPALRISTMGYFFLLLGSLLLAANIFVMTFKWKMALLKSLVAAIKAPLEGAEVKS